jgi:hypothetical protein
MIKNFGNKVYDCRENYHSTLWKNYICFHIWKLLYSVNCSDLDSDKIDASEL